MNRRANGRWIPILAVVAGLVFWFFDHGFLLNAGGAAAPVSTAIATALHVHDSPYPLPVLVPLSVLLLIGFACGVLARVAVDRGGGRPN